MATHERKIDLSKIIKELGSKQVETGFFDTARYEDGTPIAGVAVVQDQGSVKKGIPPRPFFSVSLNKGKENYASVIRRGLKAVISGELSVENVLEQVGEASKGDIQKGIIDIESPALNENTLRARDRRHYSGVGSSKPLVDSGQMLQAVTYKVDNVE